MRIPLVKCPQCRQSKLNFIAHKRQKLNVALWAFDSCLGCLMFPALILFVPVMWVVYRDGDLTCTSCSYHKVIGKNSRWIP